MQRRRNRRTPSALLAAFIDAHQRLDSEAAFALMRAISYLRAPGDSVFRAFKIDVMRVEHGRLAEITTFDAKLVPAFGLPEVLP